ncbi:MAG: MoxR family ATPase [Pirellulaceae bacterium]|nr:MoxR family ATPase [Pirellulaceae bacterium]
MSFPALTEINNAAGAIRREVARIVVGQQEVIDHLMVAILAGQHCLLEAVPGSAKNLLAASLAKTLGLSFCRVHCTPNLSPAELISRAVFASHEHGGTDDESSTLPHMLLIDDILRLVPATRVVIEQAMQDGVVNLDGRRFVVPAPFLVLATKYRQDDETADVADEPRDDRYMLKIAIRFPSYHDEFHVTDAPSTCELHEIGHVLDAMQLVQFQQTARSVVAPAHVVHYAMRLVRSTRVHEGQTPDFAFEWSGTGAGPRASQHLLIAAKMRAALKGREFAGIEDVQAMIHGTLRHRLITNRNARANGITPDRVIDRMVYEIPVRIEGDDVPAVPGVTPKFDVTSDDQWLEK